MKTARMRIESLEESLDLDAAAAERERVRATRRVVAMILSDPLAHRIGVALAENAASVGDDAAFQWLTADDPEAAELAEALGRRLAELEDAAVNGCRRSAPL